MYQGAELSNQRDIIGLICITWHRVSCNGTSARGRSVVTLTRFTVQPHHLKNGSTNFKGIFFTTLHDDSLQEMRMGDVQLGSFERTKIFVLPTS